jgi:hypothetical protein
MHIEGIVPSDAAFRNMGLWHFAHLLASPTVVASFVMLVPMPFTNKAPDTRASSASF